MRYIIIAIFIVNDIIRDVCCKEEEFKRDSIYIIIRITLGNYYDVCDLTDVKRDNIGE